MANWCWNNVNFAGDELQIDILHNLINATDNQGVKILSGACSFTNHQVNIFLIMVTPEIVYFLANKIKGIRDISTITSKE